MAPAKKRRVRDNEDSNGRENKEEKVVVGRYTFNRYLKTQAEERNIKIDNEFRKAIALKWHTLDPTEKAKFFVPSAHASNATPKANEDLSKCSATLLTRCSPQRFHDIVSRFSEDQINAIKEMGFDTLVQLSCTRLRRDFCRLLICHFDTEACTIELHGKTRKISSSDFEQIMCVPEGGSSVDLRGSIEDDDVKPWHDFYFGTSEYISIAGLIKKLEEAKTVDSMNSAHVLVSHLQPPTYFNLFNMGLLSRVLERKSPSAITMDIISWNCRGICNDATVRALKDLITQNRPQIVFLCETKISRKEDFQALQLSLGFPSSVEVLSDGQSGGLALFWCAEVDIQPLTKSAHHIDAEVRGGPGEPRWRLSGFYGYARTAERDKSWQLLKDLSDLDSLPWVVIGDFNEILNNGEKIDGPPRAERQMRGFREALGYCELLDLGFQGSRATWWNSETHLRLDRAVCTPSWCDVFGYAKVIHLPPSESDHVPILLHASTVPIPKRPRRHRFKFESFWLQHADCDSLVKEKWQADFSGAPMFQVTKKITNTRMALDKWQRETFRVRQQQMMGVRTRLEELMDATVTVTIQEEKKTLMDKLHVLLSEEEAFWRQRAKIQWLKEGDSNTGFFHRKAANRKRKNVIHGLYDENGVWRDDDKGMEQIVTSYFTQMFTASPIDMEAMHHTLEAIQPCVSAEMNLQLCRNYTEEEIREALFQMYPTKSPGPDGMPPLFFQHYWDTIGKDVTEAVQNFLHTGNLLKQVNFTHICLIPKVSNPERMADLRPIALCNVIYKIWSKAIANRLKIILPSIISPFQSAFVPGRLITDNILVANEVAHFVHNKREGPEGIMALKLDLSKAYDRMEWFFLRKVMERFGFARVWIELVMQCVCSVRFSFLIRGKPRGYVSPSRGLRQGDPLSPYLFLIGAEGFSALLQKKQVLGLLPGIEVCNDAPAVNHLLFADDSMLYAQASLDACYEIQDVIETYGRASGQLVNFNKSSVVFSKNVPLELQEEVTSLLGVAVVESHERYLGLPTYVGRKKTATFQYIKDNLAKKLKGWQGKMLSGAGKDILIRVVAQALPTYAMSAFQLTKNFCEDLEQMCARFWWGSTEDKRKIHWKAWDALCLPKEEGGLGFRSLTEFNLAMLAKQAWRIISAPASLIARVYKAKYFPEGSFWSATAHTAPSYSWRSIFATRELLKSGSYWQIGSGTKVNVWSDAWVPGLPNFVPHVAQSRVNDNLNVNELMRAQGVWHEERVRALFNEAEAEAILAIPLSTRPVDDRLVWKLESRGNFTVKTAYHFAYSNSIERANVLGNVTSCFWKKIWHAKIPNTAKVTIWKICQNILPTKDRLASKQVQIESQSCVLCDDKDETILHLCRNCSYSRVIVGSNLILRQTCFTSATDEMTALDWLNYCSTRLDATHFSLLIFLLWSVWKERNCRVWDGKTKNASDVVLMATSRLQDYVFHNQKRMAVARPSETVTKWKCPPSGCVKINVDGAFNSQTKTGGTGLVFRDATGYLLTGIGRPLIGLLSAEHAELLACQCAVEFIMEQVTQPVILETDSLVVQQHLTTAGDSNFSLLGRLYEDLLVHLADLPNVRITHVNRKGNMATHLVAAQASTLGVSLDFNHVPSFLTAVIAAELCTS